MHAVAIQRDRFELARAKINKAKECANLVVLSLYCYIPPSRGLEIRTLRIRWPKDAETLRDLRVGNFIMVKDSGEIVLHFANYKTKKFVGRDELSLKVMILHWYTQIRFGNYLFLWSGKV